MSDPSRRPGAPSGSGGRPRRVGGSEGAPTVFVADEAGADHVDLDRLEALALAVLHDEGVRGEVEVSVLLVGRDAMTDLKRTYLDADADAPTDVLAFPIDGVAAESGRAPDAAGAGPRRSLDTDDAPRILGDVVICPSVAQEQAPDHAGSFKDELALLVVHGLLHLLGMDHATDDDRARMVAREQVLLRAHHGPLAGDPWSG